MNLTFPLRYLPWLFSFVTVFVFFLGCSKEPLHSSENEDDVRLPAEYEIESLTYRMASDDKIDTVNVKGGATEFSNPGNTLMEVAHVETFDDLVKTSLFEINGGGDQLPSDLDLSEFQVSVPEIYNENGTFSFYSEPFAISDTEQQKLYKSGATFGFNLKVPSHSKLRLEKSIDRHDISCSFTLILRNKTTGERHQVDGKWHGVLRYFNESFVLSEQKLTP